MVNFKLAKKNRESCDINCHERGTEKNLQCWRVGSQTYHTGFFVLFLLFCLFVFFVCLFVFFCFFFAVYELRVNTWKCWGRGGGGGEGSYNAVMCLESTEHDCSKWSSKLATCLLLCVSFEALYYHQVKLWRRQNKRFSTPDEERNFVNDDSTVRVETPIQGISSGPGQVSPE